MAEKNWWDTGFGGLGRAEAEGAKRGVRRYYMKPGTARNLVWLDNDPFCFWEHDIKLGDEYHNYFVCLHGLAESCPFCEHDKRSRYYVGYWTTVDLDGFIAKDGKQIKNLRSLFGAKQTILKKIKMKIENRLGGSIAGAKFLVTRVDDQKSSRVGDDFEFIERVDLKTLVDSKGNPITPYDYRKIFVPMTVEQARQVLRGVSEGGPVEEEGPDGEDVPF